MHSCLFKSKFVSSYNLSYTAISIIDFQNDLGLVVSNDFSWANHYNHIIPCAYKILELIRCSFSPSLNLSMKMKLYLALVHSQLMYCTPIWRPYLQKDIQNNIERIQRHATKFILNDYDSNYKTQLLTLKLLPLMYLFELQDIILLLNHLNIQLKASAFFTLSHSVHAVHVQHPIISLNTFHILITIIDTHSFTNCLEPPWHSG